MIRKTKIGLAEASACQARIAKGNTIVRNKTTTGRLIFSSPFLCLEVGVADWEGAGV
jgi:hypothetical protein